MRFVVCKYVYTVHKCSVEGHFDKWYSKLQLLIFPQVLYGIWQTIMSAHSPWQELLWHFQVWFVFHYVELLRGKNGDVIKKADIPFLKVHERYTLKNNTCTHNWVYLQEYLQEYLWMFSKCMNKKHTSVQEFRFTSFSMQIIVFYAYFTPYE